MFGIGPSEMLLLLTAIGVFCIFVAAVAVLVLLALYFTSGRPAYLLRTLFLVLTVATVLLGCVAWSVATLRERLFRAQELTAEPPPASADALPPAERLP
jgi:hypothetical protein